jgi:hypothetical protein
LGERGFTEPLAVKDITRDDENVGGLVDNKIPAIVIGTGILAIFSTALAIVAIIISVV